VVAFSAGGGGGKRSPELSAQSAHVVCGSQRLPNKSRFYECAACFERPVPSNSAIRFSKRLSALISRPLSRAVEAIQVILSLVIGLELLAQSGPGCIDK
jgi:hypothetical protein